ncbi:hypothetical protein DPMN_114552 [Dreissena polymorpha]|uniref:Uncharacterized protein n=1 Tax=Dreissena polymorpha TaxID=45954 RepID=A0A9D4QSY6_DREPO|nr:hypothetical protein DPMN_114552 [Dreissena polymorpha]
MYNGLCDQDLKKELISHEINDSFAPKRVLSCLEDKRFDEAYTHRRLERFYCAIVREEEIGRVAGRPGFRILPAHARGQWLGEPASV